VFYPLAEAGETTGFHELSRDTHGIKRANLIISFIKIPANPLSPQDLPTLSIASSSINNFAGLEIFKIKWIKIY
jgi:hypothetical protein